MPHFIPTLKSQVSSSLSAYFNTLVFLSRSPRYSTGQGVHKNKGFVVRGLTTVVDAADLTEAKELFFLDNFRYLSVGIGNDSATVGMIENHQLVWNRTFSMTPHHWSQGPLPITMDGGGDIYFYDHATGIQTRLNPATGNNEVVIDYQQSIIDELSLPAGATADVTSFAYQVGGGTYRMFWTNNLGTDWSHQYVGKFDRDGVLVSYEWVTDSHNGYFNRSWLDDYFHDYRPVIYRSMGPGKILFGGVHAGVSRYAIYDDAMNQVALLPELTKLGPSNELGEMLVEQYDELEDEYSWSIVDPDGVIRTPPGFVGQSPMTFPQKFLGKILRSKNYKAVTFTFDGRDLEVFPINHGEYRNTDTGEVMYLGYRFHPDLSEDLEAMDLPDMTDDEIVQEILRRHTILPYSTPYRATTWIAAGYEFEVDDNNRYVTAVEANVRAVGAADQIYMTVNTTSPVSPEKQKGAGDRPQCAWYMHIHRKRQGSSWSDTLTFVFPPHEVMPAV